MILLDTSFLIRALIPAAPEGRRLESWLDTGEELRMSTVAWTEFLCGPLDEEQAAQAMLVVGEPIAFEAVDCPVAARLYNLGGRRRGTMEDCMIAATALRLDVRLATANRRDFLRFRQHGLRLAEDGE
jgi:predicted nucleic acid-binding protein